ncbi:MAG TPA: carbohydrate-binding protein [Verrucomicrobiae bacterium]|nr:carbohydrate-binding protein [Verrucomicrobiae bacterium]
MLKRLVPIVLSVIAWNASQPRVTANDIEPTKEFYSAVHRGSAPVVLDGKLNEWTGVPVLADPKFSIPKGPPVSGNYVLFETLGGSWSGPDDQTSAVQIAWDSDNVYFGFVVTDDYHEDMGGNAWNGDSIQLMIADSARASQIALYNYALLGYEDDKTQPGTLTFVPDPNQTDPTLVETEAGPGGTSAVITRDSVNHKTFYEIQLPAASLGLTAPLTAGTKFGLGMAINDGDGYDDGAGNVYGQGAAQQGQKGWGGLGAHAIVFGKTPSETALITLTTNLPGTDIVFLSAINPGIASFSFRATDKGTSIVDPAGAKLTINSKTVALTASPKVGDATDFSYTPPTPFPPGTTNNYAIEVKDTTGHVASDSGTFVTPSYALLVTSDKVTADTSKPGFIWRVHQNGAFTANTISRAMDQLAGSLGQNLADPNAVGPALAPATKGPNTNSPVTFEIATVINMDITQAGTGDFATDDQMAGVPGTGDSGQTDGIAAEVIYYLELTPGLHTFIVNSDDDFRTYVGNINDVFAAKLAGSFEDPAGRGFADTSFSVYVPEAGVYPFRTVWEQGGGGGNIELIEQLASGKVLLNDTANGGPKAYRSATGPNAGGLTVISSVSPGVGSRGVLGNTPITVTITEGSNTVDLASVKLTLNGTPATVTPTRNGNVITATFQPPTALAAGSQNTVGITYSAAGVSRTETYAFSTTILGPGTLFIEAEDFNFGHGQWVTNAPIGMTGPYPGGNYQDLGDGVSGADCDGTDFGIDYHENNVGNDPGAVPAYRSNTDVEAAKPNGPAGLYRGTFNVSVNNNIGWTSSGEWENYTRQFPATAQIYKVYARMAHGDATMRRGGQLSRITSDPTQCNQTEEVVGIFDAPWTGGWDTWPDAGTPQDALIPMHDAAGADALLKVGGLTTLRFTFKGGAGDFDYLAFVPSGLAGLPPKVASASPAAGAFGLGSKPPFKAVIQDGEVSSVTSAALFLNGTPVSPAATVTKSGANTTVSFTPTTALPLGSANVYRLVYTDNATPAVTRTNDIPFTVSFTPFNEGTLFIEAEDFNFSHGQWLTNTSIGMNGPYKGGDYKDKGDGAGGSDCDGTDFGIDYHENNVGNDPGAVPAYRLNADVEVAKPNGPAGLRRGSFDVQVNNNIGWTSAGEWENYTRVFPTNGASYKVYARMAHGDTTQTRGGQLSRVTSDPTQCNQTEEVLGTFTAPWTGGWDTWPDAGTTQDALIPMKDATGTNDAVLQLSGKQTLRFTFEQGAGDFDYLAFVPQGGSSSGAPNLSIAKSSTEITITFDGSLESATAVTGPWGPEPGTSPKKIPLPATGNFKFYRAKK